MFVESNFYNDDPGSKDIKFELGVWIVNSIRKGKEQIFNFQKKKEKRVEGQPALDHFLRTLVVVKCSDATPGCYTGHGWHVVLHLYSWYM